jgi:uncharacterized protein (TIGR00369 family)
MSKKMKQFKTVEESQVSMSLLMTPVNSNFSGKIHGGYILGLMDQIAFLCASKHSGNYCVTASVNKVDFLNPVDVGQMLHLKASINYTGNTSMVVGLHVESENIRTGEILHCNSSYFTMVAKDEDGNSVKVPGLILSSTETIRRFARSVQRQHETSVRKENFKPSEFEVKDYIDLLKGHNLQLQYDY